MNSTIFKERPSGGYYCAECRMSFGELHTTCPYCGSFISNYEDLLIKEENDTIHPMFNLDSTTGKNKFASDFQGKRMYISPVDDSSFISQEEIQKIIIEMKVKTNESNFYRRN